MSLVQIIPIVLVNSNGKSSLELLIYVILQNSFIY